MIVYGTKIKSDIDFPLDLSHETETRYEVELSSNVPLELKQSVTHSFYLYWTHGRNVYLYSDKDFDGSEVRKSWCYEVQNVVRIYWYDGERSIYYEFDEEGDANLLSFWFIHLLLPLYMTLENMYDFIHAGAVEVDNKPILFIAPSMGGKSTLTDYFIKKGHTLISDDKVPTFIHNGELMAVGSHPYHRPFREFEVFGYRVENFIEEFKPIHIFYVLEKVDNDTDIVIEEIKGFTKFDILLTNYLYTFNHLKSRRLQHISIILNSIRVFRIKRPWDMEYLGKVYSMICEHSKVIK